VQDHLRIDKNSVFRSFTVSSHAFMVGDAFSRQLFVISCPFVDLNPVSLLDGLDASFPRHLCV